MLEFKEDINNYYFEFIVVSLKNNPEHFILTIGANMILLKHELNHITPLYKMLQ